MAVGGARAKKGRREGTLEYSRSQEKLMVRSGSKLESLDAFVEAVVGQQDRPKEHVFLSKNDEPLVEYETTLSGYGRPVRFQYDIVAFCMSLALMSTCLVLSPGYLFTPKRTLRWSVGLRRNLWMARAFAWHSITTTGTRVR